MAQQSISDDARDLVRRTMVSLGVKATVSAVHQAVGGRLGRSTVGRVMKSLRDEALEAQAVRRVRTLAAGTRAASRHLVRAAEVIPAEGQGRVVGPLRSALEEVEAMVAELARFSRDCLASGDLQPSSIETLTAMMAATTSMLTSLAEAKKAIAEAGLDKSHAQEEPRDREHKISMAVEALRRVHGLKTG
jgi:hypothetical protein